MAGKRSIALFIGITAMFFILYGLWWKATHEVKIRTEYRQPHTDELSLRDDELSDKRPTFDPDIIDSRLLGDWQVNKSAAVIGLDAPVIKPDREKHFLTLRPSYADAVKVAGENLLVSANMIDGKGKQFDDGLYAALDLAAFRGNLGIAPAAPALVKAIFERLPAASPARPFLAAGLELAGERVDLNRAEQTTKKNLLGVFDENKAKSKPISFYTWTSDLEKVWRFFRFFQEEFGESSLDIPLAISAVLREKPELLDRYKAVNAFYGRLTNPLVSLSIDLLEEGVSLKGLASKHGARRATVALFPPSTSRENELFARLFGGGLPPGSNLMNELIARIISGEVDLKPKEEDGWYQHQVYALETLLMPSLGQEKEKLLLTASYKRRLVEAFKALMTKRRETHARQMGIEMAMAPLPPPVAEKMVKPRLRLEPTLTFYLRTARAYAFLSSFLEAAVGKERLSSLRGYRKGGMRDMELQEELTFMARLYYGFYLVSCEDIGLKPAFHPGEEINRAEAYGEALDWLQGARHDPDLAVDTRISVPIFIDPLRRVTRLWATLGVRLAKIEASYARPPALSPKEGLEWPKVDMRSYDPEAQAMAMMEPVRGGNWRIASPYQVDSSDYLIPIDEFAEFEIEGLNVLTRKELRKICDRHGTKEEILKALR